MSSSKAKRRVLLAAAIAAGTTIAAANGQMGIGSSTGGPPRHDLGGVHHRHHPRAKPYADDEQPGPREAHDRNCHFAAAHEANLSATGGSALIGGHWECSPPLAP